MSEALFPQTDRTVLQRISQSAGGKAGYKQLVRELKLGGGRERRLMVEQLQGLVARGELVQLEQGLWAIPQKPDASGGRKTNAAGTAGRGGSGGGVERSGRDRLLSGRLDVHRDGFGFVRPDGAPAGSGKGEDIFISPHDINGAMQGDLVLVDEAPPGRDGRRSGRIARVLTRRNPTVVGIFHYAGAEQPAGRRGYAEAGMRENYVKPLDERMSGVIAIPEGAEVVAAAGESPHRMLGEEARRARAADASGEQQILYEDDNKKGNRKSGDRGEWPLEGLAVDVEITSFPAPGRPARGRVIEVLGPPDAFGVDVEIVIRKHHIPHAFPLAVLAEAEERAKEGLGSGLEDLAPPLIAQDAREEWGTRTPGEWNSRGPGREDFRGLPIVTIDGETARDFDDAVLLRGLANGNTELQVHIADVSWYVTPGSALDTEARVRGTSVYFPDRAVPMLPHALSSGMCSLLPEEDRLVLSCVMEIDARGEIVGYRVAEGVIRSVRRMTYTSVQHCLNAGALRQRTVNSEQLTAKPVTAEDFAERERVGLEQPELPAAFDAMLELALRLNAKRVRRGSIDFDLPEPVVEFDPDGNMKAIVRSERGWAHRLIEEFMLSANECVATWLEQQGVASMYRIHEMPDPKRIVEFEETAAGFGQSLGIGNLPVRKLTMKTDRRAGQRNAVRGRDSRAAQRHEIPESIPVTPQMYQRLVRRIAGTPEERILAYLMLRSLKQARYAEKNEGHFALASPAYTHFTSPIRRYPDLIVHRLVRAMLRAGADARGGAIRSDDAQPWSGTGVRGGKTAGLSTAAQKRASGRDDKFRVGARKADPIAAEELNDIAVESSQAERRAADAERELIEWKKMKFMADKVGEDFHAVILSVTKYGFFVELDDMFIEGLVPIGSLVGDFYAFRDTDRTICGARTGHCFALGQRVEVILDRIDRQQRRLQFALLPGTEPKAASLRTRVKKEPKEEAASPKRSGKAETRARNKKNKGRR